MSKRSLFWGQASGKLGEAVFYRAKGEQRTRTYVAKIANPKTLAQVSNRVAMLNLVSGYRSISSVLGKSFIDKRSNESDYNAFIRNSKNANTAGITRLQAQVGWCCPYGFAISRGKIAFNGEMSFGLEKFAQILSLSSAAKLGGMTVNQFLAIYDAEGANGYTGDQIYKVIIGQTNPINLPTRFKLNLVIGASNGDAWELGCYQIEIYQGSTDTLHLVAGKDVYAGQKMIISMKTTDAESELPLTDFTFCLSSVPGPESKNAFAGCFISSTTSGKLDVSNANMAVEGGSANVMVEQYLPGGNVWDDILGEMGYVPNSVLA